MKKKYKAHCITFAETISREVAGFHHTEVCAKAYLFLCCIYCIPQTVLSRSQPLKFQWLCTPKTASRHYRCVLCAVTISVTIWNVIISLMNLHCCTCSQVLYFLKHWCNQHLTSSPKSKRQLYPSNKSAAILQQHSLAFAELNFCSQM